MRKFFVLFAFFFTSIALQAQYPVVGNDSDFVWVKEIQPVDLAYLQFHPNLQHIAMHFYDPTDKRVFILDALDSGKIIKVYHNVSDQSIPFRFSPSGKYIGLLIGRESGI